MIHPISIIVEVALLTLFLIFVTAAKYAIPSRFERTRLSMSAFFIFIVATLSISFWHYAMATFPYTVPAALVGALVGYFLGVRAAEEKLRMQGLAHYMEHFAHIHVEDFVRGSWWSVINFYTICGGLILINLVGLSNVIFGGAEQWAIATSVVGAFLLGTIFPYLVHLWSIQAPRH